MFYIRLSILILPRQPIKTLIDIITFGYFHHGSVGVIRINSGRRIFSEGAQTAGREYWIERLQIGIKMNHGKFTFPTKDHFFWNSDNPVVTIKTGMGLRSLTGHLKISMDKLPMWGSTNELRSEIWGTK